MAEDVEESAIQTTEAPFQPSWIDRLIQWIDRLPGPTWLIYVLGIVTASLLSIVIVWIDGSVPFGSIGRFDDIFNPIHFYPLALYHYLTRIGSRSLQAYRPLLDVDDAGIAQIDYELATLPRRLGWLAILLGFGLAVPLILDESAAFRNPDRQTALPDVVAVATFGFFLATIVCLMARSIRQLRMVRKLHARAMNISLLKLEPAHAFSTLTARTGIGVILILILGSAFAILVDPSEFGTSSNIGGYSVIAFFAVIIFVVPVIGMRDRLEQEKKRVLDETSNLLQSASDDLHSKASRGAYDDFGGIEGTISALIRERELMGGISTSPWNPGTIRGFASTLLLPIFLWLVTQLLGRFF